MLAGPLGPGLHRLVGASKRMLPESQVLSPVGCGIVSVDTGGRQGGAVTAVAFDDSFLQDHDPRKWSAPAGAPKTLTPTIFFLGKGDHGLEVALAGSRTRPRADDVRALWRARRLTSSISVVCEPLPEELQRQVDRIQRLASDEVTPR
jgi:hypothetical protein